MHPRRKEISTSTWWCRAGVRALTPVLGAARCRRVLKHQSNGPDYLEQTALMRQVAAAKDGCVIFGRNDDHDQHRNHWECEDGE